MIYAFKLWVCLIWSVCRALQKSNSYLLPAGHYHTQKQISQIPLVLSDHLNKHVQSVLETMAAVGLWIRCCMMLLVLEVPWLPTVWRSRAWHQVLFLRVLQNVIGLWCNGIPSCCSRFTQIGMAGTSMHAQASKNLKPPPKAMSDVFINVTGHWDGLGLECLPGVWGTRCSVPCFAPDFIFCLKQITSLLWLSSLAVQWK